MPCATSSKALTLIQCVLTDSMCPVPPVSLLSETPPMPTGVWMGVCVNVCLCVLAAPAPEYTCASCWTRAASRCSSAASAGVQCCCSSEARRLSASHQTSKHQARLGRCRSKTRAPHTKKITMDSQIVLCRLHDLDCVGGEGASPFACVHVCDLVCSCLVASTMLATEDRVVIKEHCLEGITT